jgi:DNA-binding XRE family transcriptional regulator
MSEQLREPLVNYLRMHRRSVGLSQAELGRVLGYRDETAVANHERFESMPPFLTALGYEVIFQIPASEIFGGVKQTVTVAIEARLAEFEHRLRENGRRTPSPRITRTLEWLEDRRAPRIHNDTKS